MPQAVKTFFYHNSNSSGEANVKRFQLDKVDIAYLEGRIKDTYNLSNKIIIKIRWKDADGNRINCSTDAELRDAIKGVKDGVLQLYVNINDGKDEEEEPQNRNVNRSGSVESTQSSELLTHPGVSCDECYQTPVRGMRYKCLACPDYDLCRRCENSGCHPEHDMIRITSPAFAKSYHSNQMVMAMIKGFMNIVTNDGSDSSDSD